MTLKVPPDHVVYIRELLKLPDETMDRFLSALDTADPQFNFADLARQIPTFENVPPFLTEGVVRVLVSLYRTGDRGKPVPRFLDEEVFPALKRAKAFSEEDGDAEWEKLRKFLLGAMCHERTVGTAAKAGPVQTDHERIFVNAKINTDLRPIYHFDVSEKPDAATMVHMLKITHRNQYSHKSDVFIALDSNDLATLKEVIERALKKEETLRAVMKNTGVTVLGAGLFY
jgi:hypothetical protein